MVQIRLFTIALLLFVVATTAEAQSITVTGRVVHEQTGSPQVRVPLYLMGTPKAAITDSNGSYVFRDVTPGSYELVAVFPGLGQITEILEVTDSEDIVHDFTVPYAISAPEEAVEMARTDASTAAKADDPVSRSGIVIQEVETVCSCYSSAVSLLDQAFELRGRFATKKAFEADAAAGKEMNSLLSEWTNLQRQCLSQFGTKLFEESACNKPSEISRKRQALSDIGIRS